MTDIVVGANAERSRNHNRKVVLGRVRAAGQIGRAEIARASGLSTQAVSNIIADLLDDGLILEDGRRTAGRGLPAVQYTLNPEGGFALGVEVRPDAVFATLLNLRGQTVVSDRHALAKPDHANIATAVTSLRDRVLHMSNTPADRVLGAGIVMPGPFGKSGILGDGSEFQIWDDHDPVTWFSEILQMTVLVENDANAAAIAERITGVAQDLETYAFIYFGSGLGLGVVHKGRLMAGAFGNAGEIGHIPVQSGGQQVMLESVVSRLSVQRALASSGTPAGSVDDLDRLYSQGNLPLLDWLDAAVAPLSTAIVTVENLFDPQAVILGGAMPDTVLDHLVATIHLSDRSVSHRDHRDHPRLLRGASGRRTATLGAATLVIDQAFTPTITAQL
ncbi:ROK family transcriptional regulator [Actibacterium sp. 188UL27-1]|uniref:ROK family transcriptional regulator n=1 Tax=Actibacterium sp. 188UL27-1 TaxID=2786961 RepID=UPI00195C0154|nr:ROK family transcriptional regulator [Actibacterium sp. 188UL27-1]MBM7069810.1 ROK family transcriptional regulator [Actibacterium sp. 188UL27-1]